MRELPLELIRELAEILVFGVGTTILSALGVRIELLAATAATAGDTTFGLWLCLLGGVAFYFGLYAMGLTELLPRLRLVVTRRAE